MDHKVGYDRDHRLLFVDAVSQITNLAYDVNPRVLKILEPAPWCGTYTSEPQPAAPAPARPTLTYHLSG